MTNGIPSDVLIRFGHALETLRLSRGYSQKGLSLATGVMQSSISRMEAGKNFYFGNLVLLLKELEKEVGDFFVDAGFTDESPNYKSYTFTIRVKAYHVKNITGSVDGPGIRRATENSSDSTSR